ncbi:unnamed protein product, partial [Polarella glacialis]
AECGKWHDTAPEGCSKTAGQTLAMEFLNLYHLNAWLILPASKDANCAMVELMAAKKQTPAWFITHWWGEPIGDFVACVAKHVCIRCLSRDSPYWVCAYANRQHSLDDELSADPTETSFCK